MKCKASEGMPSNLDFQHLTNILTKVALNCVGGHQAMVLVTHSEVKILRWHDTR